MDTMCSLWWNITTIALNPLSIHVLLLGICSYSNVYPMSPMYKSNISNSM